MIFALSGCAHCQLPHTHYWPVRARSVENPLWQKNAFIFNAPDSLYFKAARQLSEVFEKKVEEIEREVSAAHMCVPLTRNPRLHRLAGG